MHWRLWLASVRSPSSRPATACRTHQKRRLLGRVLSLTPRIADPGHAGQLRPVVVELRTSYGGVRAVQDTDDFVMDATGTVAFGVGHAR